MRKFIFLPILFLLMLSSCISTPILHRHQAHRLNLFDTIITLNIYTESEEDFQRYSNIIFNRLETLHKYYDIFNAYEGINNIHTINSNAGIKPVQVNQEIIDLLLASKEAYTFTDGMTNIAMGSVLRIWHRYRAHGITNPDYATLPSLETLAQASQLTNISNIIIDTENNTVFLTEKGMSIDVGSIAKGFAAELAIDAAVEAGATNILLNAGGHVVARGNPVGQASWHVGIQNPDRTPEASPAIDALFITNSTISISGGHLRYYYVDGQYFGHIIDPATAMPASRYQMVIVIHPVSWMADILSTALFILPIEEGRVLAVDAGADALWINADGSLFATEGYMEKSTIIYRDEE